MSCPERPEFSSYGKLVLTERRVSLREDRPNREDVTMKSPVRIAGGALAPAAVIAMQLAQPAQPARAYGKPDLTVAFGSFTTTRPTRPPSRMPTLATGTSARPPAPRWASCGCAGTWTS